MIKNRGTVIAIFTGIYLLGIIFSHAFSQVTSARTLVSRTQETFELSDQDVNQLVKQLEGHHCDYDRNGQYNPSAPGLIDSLFGNWEATEYQCRSTPLHIFATLIQQGDILHTGSQAVNTLKTVDIQNSLPKIHQILLGELQIAPLSARTPPDSLQLQILEFLGNVKHQQSLDVLTQFYNSMRSCKISIPDFEGIRGEICSKHRYKTMQTILSFQALPPSVAETIFIYARDSRDKPKAHYFSLSNYDELNQKQSITALLELVISQLDDSVRHRAASEIGYFGQDANFIVLKMAEVIEEKKLVSPLTQALIASLGKINTPAADRALKRLENHSNHIIRDSAQSTLESLGLSGQSQSSCSSHC